MLGDMWAEFAYSVKDNTFLIDLLANSFQQAYNIPAEFIKDAIKKNKIYEYPEIVKQAQIEQEKPKAIETKDDTEFLPFLCMEETSESNNNNDNNGNSSSNDSGSLESRISSLNINDNQINSCAQFVQASFLHQINTLLQTNGSGLHPLVAELYAIHKEAKDFELIKSVLNAFAAIFSQSQQLPFPKFPEDWAHLKRLFISNGWICLISVFCFSYHDAIRELATKVLMIFSESPSTPTPSKHKLEYMATTMYLFQADIPRWYNGIREHTFGTKIIDLSKKEGQALAHAYEIFRHQLGLRQDKEEKEIIQKLEARLDKIIETEYNRKCFAKLSSRSPKDAIFELERFKQLNEADIQKYKEVHGCEEVPNLISQGISQKNAALAMVVTSGKDVLELFMTSVRCYQDIKSCLDLSPHFFVSIILREWCYCPVDREFRGFIRGGKLNGLSQYFSKSYFPDRPKELLPTIKDRVVNFHESIKHLLVMDDYVMDFLVLDDKVQIIEVNCYGNIAGPALFDWAKDFERLVHGPCELRVIVDEAGTVQSF